MFEAANDDHYNEKTVVAEAQKRQRDINMAYHTRVPPYYVFQCGIYGNQFGYVTKYGYCDVGFNSFSDAAEAAEEYTQRVGR